MPILGRWKERQVRDRDKIQTAHKGARRDSNSELYNCEADVRAIMYHRVTQQHNLVKT